MKIALLLLATVRLFGQFPVLAGVLGPTTASVDATPTFSPGAGTYSSTQSVTISTVTSGATICYTTDGTTPTATVPGTCDGNTYSTALSVSTSQTIKAIATKLLTVNSAVGSAAYVISAITVTGTCIIVNQSGEPTCTWSSNPTTGANIACISENFGSGSFTHQTDNASPANTYTQNGSSNTSGPYSPFTAALADTFNIAHSPSTSSAVFASYSTPGTFCIAYTGGSGARDGTMAANGGTSGGASNGMTAALDPSGSADVGLCLAIASSTASAGTGWTGVSSGNANYVGQYKLLSASGSQNATASNSSNSTDWKLLCATYQ